MALVNTSQAPQTISVKIQTTGGAISQGILSNIPAQGHIAFTLPAQFAATAGQSGLAEFYTASGTIALLALNFNPAGSLSTAPAYPEAGPPIIGVVGGGAALFSTFGPVEMQWQPAGFAAGAVLLTLTPNADNSTYSAQINGGATFTNGIFTGNGLSFSASVLQPNATVPPYGYLLEPDSTLRGVSGSLTFNLGATVISSNVQTGNISGTLSITGTLRRWRPSYAIRPDLRTVLRNCLRTRFETARYRKPSVRRLAGRGGRNGTGGRRTWCNRRGHRCDVPRRPRPATGGG